MNEDVMQKAILEKLRKAAEQGFPKRLYYCHPKPEIPEGATILPAARLNIILSGSKRVKLPLKNGIEEIELKPGDAYFAPPGTWELHFWDTASEMLCIVPRQEYLRVSYYDQLTADERPEAFYHHTGRLCSEPINQVVRLLQSSENAEDPSGAALDLARALVRFACQDCARPSLPEGNRAARHFAQISTWLENHFQEAIGREETARQFSITPTYLSHIFRKITGQSFHSFLTRLRIDFARYLLLHTELPVYLIGSQSGFGNYVHFVRRFRQIHGASPGRFRENARKPENSAQEPKILPSDGFKVDSEVDLAYQDDNMQKTTETSGFAGRWVSYREEIKVLDCTIRDGGLMNDSKFDDRTVKAVYDACVDAGIDYMEVGYKASKKIFARDRYGAWRFCDEGDIRRIVGDNPTSLKISVMADAEKTDYHHDILPKEQSVIDMVRVATYIHQIPTALDMVKDANDKGYETCLNLMSVSNVLERELDEALEMVAKCEAKAICLVDSFGALYSEQVDYLMDKYLRFAKTGGKEVGVHMHNNLQLAFSNTIQGIVKGANFLDATIGGLGRGAGNCPMELLLRFLHNPKYNVRPVLKCLQEAIEPMREELGWGFSIPYMLTGFMNRHPRSAIEWQDSLEKDNIVAFYDKIIVEEEA